MSSNLLLLDTLSKEKKEISPADGDTLGFYCCGPTVYAAAHIGNFRTFVVQDFFRRVVELSGIKVNHVRNVTDVDDKTIRDSQASNVSLTEFTEKWTNIFHSDCEKLNLLKPTHEPRAVAHIDESISMIETLESKGLAYKAEDGSVYFRVSAFEGYGKLSKLDSREIRSNETASSLADEYDRESLVDFALWKTRKPEDGDNFWQSPWGEGRPGWHIECSSMSQKYLGETFDVHSGGVDLVFPHHDNEIAQSEGAHGCTFARHWFHITHLLVDGSKMSKSVGNLYTLSQLEEKGFSGGDLRYALLMGHFRKPLNFTLDSLEIAQQNRKRLGKLLDKLLSASGRESLPTYEELISQNGSIELADSFKEAWHCLLDDLNSPGALGGIFKGIKPLETAKEIDPDLAAKALDAICFLLSALGLTVEANSSIIDIPADIISLAEQRDEARKHKNWQEADALRAKIEEAGWQVKDIASGFELVKS